MRVQRTEYSHPLWIQTLFSAVIMLQVLQFFELWRSLCIMATESKSFVPMMRVWNKLILNWAGTTTKAEAQPWKPRIRFWGLFVEPISEFCKCFPFLETHWLPKPDTNWKNTLIYVGFSVDLNHHCGPRSLPHGKLNHHSTDSTYTFSLRVGEDFIFGGVQMHQVFFQNDTAFRQEGGF